MPAFNHDDLQVNMYVATDRDSATSLESSDPSGNRRSPKLIREQHSIRPATGSVSTCKTQDFCPFVEATSASNVVPD